MSWEKVPLGTIADTSLGKMLDAQKNKGEFQPYLANVNVRWGSFDLDDLPLMRFEPNEEEKYGLSYGDLVMCEGGEPGRCALWKNQLPDMKIQKALHRVRAHADIDIRYLYYWFLHAGRRGILDQYFTGSTIKHMPEEKLKEVVIDKPPLPIQRRIADILSAYDDLIENNQRQIKLFEEAAMRLYREWFVFMRFPGHESVRIEDGVPEGWRQGYLSDIIVNVGMPASKDDRDSFEYYLPIDCLPNKSLALEEVSDISNAQSSLISFNEGDILFGAMRPYFHKVLPSPVKGLTRGTCFVISPKEIHYYSYVLMLLFSEETIRYATTVSVGTTMPYVRWSDFVQMKVTIPGEDIVIKFNELIQPIIASLKKYFFMNRNLRIVRDALLPRLMNGGVGLKLEGGTV